MAWIVCLSAAITTEYRCGMSDFVHNIRYDTCKMSYVHWAMRNEQWAMRALTAEHQSQVAVAGFAFRSLWD